MRQSWSPPSSWQAINLNHHELYGFHNNSSSFSHLRCNNNINEQEYLTAEEREEYRIPARSLSAALLDAQQDTRQEEEMALADQQEVT